ncbi:hypothetical protein DX933_14325 [Ornithinibacillus gellani]|nr:hypothetical protein DX933_14325 [Ornithinibacillus gellani]
MLPAFLFFTSFHSFSIYHRLTGCKPPPRILVDNKNDKWGATASKGLIGSTNNQWVKCIKPPLIEVSLI